MKQITYPKKLEVALSKYWQAGGVLEYVLFELAKTENPDYVAINVAALKEICKESRTQPTSDVSKMTSQKITPEEFVGPYYDIKSQRLIVRGEISIFLNDYFYYDQPENLENKIPSANIDEQASIYEGSAKGYADAFTDPPYNMRMKNIELGQLYLEINSILFDTFDDDLDILLWSDNWSPYFDDGKEWWGAYWWTIHNKTKNMVIVIAASSTD